MIHRCNCILLSEVYCVWQVVKTKTISLNNPVYTKKKLCVKLVIYKNWSEMHVQQNIKFYGLTDEQDNKARNTQTNESLSARTPFFLQTVFWNWIPSYNTNASSHVLLRAKRLHSKPFTFSIINTDVKVSSCKLYDSNSIQCHFLFVFSKPKFHKQFNP